MAKIEKTEYYYELFHTMIREDEARDDDFRQYDDMYHFNWELPAGFEELEWISKYVSPVAHDTVNVTIKTLGTNEPHVHYFPLDSTEISREWANNIEEVLKWNYYLARKRRRGNQIADIVRHACTYHTVCVNTVDIDHQIESMKIAKLDAGRFETMRHYSRFMVNLYHPSLVHFRYSNIMLESVLLAQRKTAYQIYKEYGDKAKSLIEKAKSSDKQEWWNIYDFMDDNVHTIIATPDDVGTSGKREDMVIIMEPQAHKLKFIPWTISCGGSDSELSQRDQYHGILYPLLRGQLWEFLNRAESLIHSKAVSQAGQPSFAETGNIPMNQRSTVIDRDDPAGIVQVTPGNELQTLQQNQTSPAMQEGEVRLRTDITSTTGTQSLQLIGVPEGTAYATLSLLMQNAAGNIDVYKQVAEEAIEGVFRNMLLWSHYRDVPLEGLGKNWKDKNKLGMQYKIDPQEIDPYRIYMQVELRQNLPIDQMQRVNTATMAVQALGLSQETAQEMCGIDDPIREMNKRRFEILQDAELARYNALKDGEVQMKIEEMKAAAAMQQQALQAQQQPQGMANSQVSGPGFNPAQGGTPPAMADRNATREMQSGMTQAGQPSMV